MGPYLLKFNTLHLFPQTLIYCTNFPLPTDKIEKTNLSNIITETEKGIVCEKTYYAFTYNTLFKL